MFHLFLATMCSAMIALIFKFTETRQTNRYVITSANYFIAFTTSLLMIYMKKIYPIQGGINQFVSEYRMLFSGELDVFSPFSSIIWGMIIGSIAGVFFFLSFIFYQKSVQENGVALSGTFAKLGILIPMIFSIILWRELPTCLQWIGIVLSLVAIIIVNLSKASKDKFDVNTTLILLFLFGGMAEFSNKIYQNYALNDYKDVFLFFVFFVAFLISSVYSIKKKSTFTLKDVFIGFGVGIPNLFSSYFLILALDTLKTSVVFPIYSAGSIVLITILGWLIFGETIKRKNVIAIVMIIIALILMNSGM